MYSKMVFAFSFDFTKKCMYLVKCLNEKVKKRIESVVEDQSTREYWKNKTKNEHYYWEKEETH